MVFYPHFSPRRIWLIFLASIVAVVLVLVVIGVLGEYTKTSGRHLLTWLSLGGCALLALPASALSQRGRFPYLGCSGVAAALAAYLLLLGGIWGTPNSDAYWKAVGITSIFAVAFFQVCWLLLMTPKHNLAKSIQLGAGVAAGLVPLVAGVGILAEIESTPFWWGVAIIVIVQVLFGIAARVVNRLAIRAAFRLRP